MAIYTGGMRMYDEKVAASKRIAEQQTKALAGESKRKGRAGMFGKIGGFLAGEGLWTLFETALAGATGGSSLAMTSLIKALRAGGKATKLAKAVIQGVAMTGAKALTHQATTGKLLGKRFKTPGQVGKIIAGGKYGYGRGEAATLSEALTESRKSKEDLGTLAARIGGSFATQIAGEGLGGLFKGKVGKADINKPDFQLADIFAEAVHPVHYGGITDSGDKPFWDQVDPIGSQLEEALGMRKTEYNPFEFDEPFDFAQGGQVPSQEDAFMELLSLVQPQQQEETAYSDTPLEEEKQPSIVDYFASQGKTLGGNNTQPLSQMLGR